MTDEREELMLEILKRLQSSVATLRNDMQDVRAVQNDMRFEIHSMRGDFLRFERMVAEVKLDIDRIKTRLDLVDA